MFEVFFGMVTVFGLVIIYQLGLIVGKLRDLERDQLNRTDFIMMTAQVRDAIKRLDSE